MDEKCCIQPEAERSTQAYNWTSGCEHNAKPSFCITAVPIRLKDSGDSMGVTRKYVEVLTKAF